MKEAYKLDSAVSRLTTNTIAGGTKNTALPDTKSLSTGGSLTSMTGGTKPDNGVALKPDGRLPGNNPVPPGTQKEQSPPGLTPRGAGEGGNLNVDAARLLMMGMVQGTSSRYLNGRTWHNSHNG